MDQEMALAFLGSIQYLINTQGYEEEIKRASTSLSATSSPCWRESCGQRQTYRLHPQQPFTTRTSSKEGVSAAFAVKLFKSWIYEKDINCVACSLRKVGMDNRLMELFPANKRSAEHFSKYFTDAGLKELADFARNQLSIGARKELQKELHEQMARGDPQREIIAYTREEMKKAGLSEQAMISIIWSSVMSCVEWNKKEELVTEQAIKHLKQYSPLLKPSPPRASRRSVCWSRSRSTATTTYTS
ncbi:unnamed protein product [Gadus morhua 'NCC']